jgi:(p)ppGpp synthase/HD superfamily hydrolase
VTRACARGRSEPRICSVDSSVGQYVASRIKAALEYPAVMAESSATAPLLTDRFQRAFALASCVHASQLRKGTRIPYLAHLMSVAALVLEHGGGEDAAIGALLHDAVEDSSDGATTEARIRQEFGNRVADIVMGCSDAVAIAGQQKAPWRERKRKYLGQLAEEKDQDVLLVSACDKLHNARAIVADLRMIGPALWDRFNEKDPAAQLCYYQSLAGSYRGRVPAGLSDELKRVVAEMQSLAGS